MQAIEAVGQQVHGMMEQVLGISFPLFSKQHAPDWAAVRASFAGSNQEVQGATRALIDTSFRSGLLSLAVQTISSCYLCQRCVQGQQRLSMAMQQLAFLTQDCLPSMLHRRP